MEGGRSNFPMLVQGFGASDVAVAEPVWHVQGLEDANRRIEMLAGQPKVAKPGLELPQESVSAGDHNLFPDHLANFHCLVELLPRLIQLTSTQAHLAEVGKNLPPASPVHV